MEWEHIVPDPAKGWTRHHPSTAILLVGRALAERLEYIALLQYHTMKTLNEIRDRLPDKQSP